jgi:hypothetical protein
MSAAVSAIPKLGDGFVHFSNLKHIARSAAHYRVSCERRLEPTPAMRFGSIVHALVLDNGPTIAVWKGRRQGNDWEAFDAANTGNLVVTQDEFERATLVTQAVLTHKVAAPWLVGDHEKHILWKYQDRECSSRLDVLGDGFVTELKTTTNTDPETFMRACAKMAYHAQLAFYSRAAAEIGRPVREWRIVSVETAPPFAVTVLRLSPRTLEAGDKLVRIWMERLLGCEAVNEFPGYVQCEVDWDMEDDPGLLIDGESVEDA